MLSILRNRLTYANVVATLALLFAMSGGALAARQYLITSTKQISPKVLKQLKGKAGAPGPEGKAGPAGKGEKGERGEKGDQGEKGASVVVAEAQPSECAEGGASFEVGGKKAQACNGENGVPGTAGESVTMTELQEGSAICLAGGAKFEVGGKTSHACNGKEGQKGGSGTNGKSVVVAAVSKGSAACKEGGASVEVEGVAASKQYACNGSPWTDGGTLPAGATETGTWSLMGSGIVRVPISFPIPLSKSLSEEGCGAKTAPCQIHFIANGTTGTAGEGCGGGSVGHPTAEPGNLCIYELGDAEAAYFFPLSPETELPNETGKTGALLLFSAEPGGVAYGVWAVTESSS